MKPNRRDFLRTTTVAASGIGMTAAVSLNRIFGKQVPFRISLAEWSLHNALNAKVMTNLDFPVKAARDFDIYGVEYVSTFFQDTGTEYLNELLQITRDYDVQNVLIMVDGEGSLGNPGETARIKSVEQHYRWVEAAKFLGCHSIRVNASGRGTESEVAAATVQGLRKLSEFAEPLNINVIVENHGGYSSNGKWLTDVISRVGMANCGTLPDFGNFTISAGETYDRYLGVVELMQYAKGVSAKSNAFDENGNETTMDYYRLLRIVYDSGYQGWIGIEYEGRELSEPEGIMATKRLLERVFAELA
ncbi:MAG: TIM barrel protein [Bacteroidales bacterium]|nr:TIM barrel protein [Bacteroidales bacterium]